MNIGTKPKIYMDITTYFGIDKSSFYQIIKWSIYHFYCHELVANKYMYMKQYLAAVTVR